MVVSSVVVLFTVGFSETLPSCSLGGLGDSLLSPPCNPLFWGVPNPEKIASQSCNGVYYTPYYRDNELALIINNSKSIKKLLLENVLKDYVIVYSAIK